MSVEIIEAYTHMDEVKVLFTEYTDMQVEGNGYLDLFKF